MRIKKLEIHGFKSFADRATLSFGDGITGVVGPNGCGKSNIIDAVRWCMGEMSAKHLRGRAMQDVIFAGSDSRGPMGMAEVTLTFQNDGDVPPQYAPFTDIAVTRRLHRDGTSEYLINKVPARLRDITDLFLGTGVGTRAYSIIEQGRIGFIVSAKPEDRRQLIEEVAGITKFKVRKKAAERRLQATEQNLLRVNDIVSELERQLASLRRQAKKAERYRELKGELRDLELHAASLEYLRLDVVEKVALRNQEQLHAALQDAQAALAASEAGLEADKLRLFEDERQLQAEQQKSAATDARVAGLERDVAHWRTQLEDTLERVELARNDVSDARVRLAAAEAEEAALATSHGEHAELRERDTATIEAIAAAADAMQSQLAAIDHDIEACRKDGIEHVHGAAQQRTLAKNLGRQRGDLVTRLEQVGSEKALNEERHAEALLLREQLASRVANLQHELSSWRTRWVELGEELEATTVRVDESEALVASLREELNQKRSRLHSLEEIARRFEGYSDGVRTLLGGESGEPQVAGIRALVTEVLTAAPKYERAIEAALGERLQYLVVDGHDDAAQAIAFLKEHDGGRGGFLPVAPRLGERFGAMAVSAGVLGTARSLVEVKAGFAGVADYLLADVLVVDTLDTALGLWSQGATDARLAGKIFVTLSGEVVDKGGAVGGGSNEGVGLLAKRREIRELSQHVADLDGKLRAACEHHDRLEAERLQLEVSRQQLDKDIRAAELEKLELDKDLQAAEKELTRLGERLEVLTYEGAQRQEELLAIDEEERLAVTLAEQAEAGQADVERRLAELNERRQQQAAVLEERKGELTSAKVQLAARDEKLTASLAAMERLRESVQALRQRIVRDEATMVEGERSTVELRARIEDGSAELAELVGEAQALRQSLSEARARYESERTGMGDVEQELRAQRRESESRHEQLTELRMELQRLQLERARLCEQVSERYDLDLLSILCDFHLRPPPGAAEEERRAEIERSIRAIGPINLTAIDECAEVEQRYSFLNQQREDLSSALEALRRAIQRINRASRERFREAFEAVNEMFQQVYPRLFHGGEARLTLVESDDVLEAGIEIIAMPPGKKPQSVTLLSGGEKALTATALIFAIFLVKPSPFCVLDEVDAPLDEANVGRFNEMLREICKFSQFIVITHNKHTMSEADRLYGITQEEPGCSKLVSVDLSRQGSGEQAA